MKLADFDLLSIGDTVQMSGVMYSGQGRTLLCFFPEDTNDSPLEELVLTHDDWAALLNQSDMLNTEVTARAADGTLKKAILRKCQRTLDQVVSWKVYKRDAYRCRYCGRDDVPLTVDHLVCWESGGPSTEANLVAACKKCNKARGKTSYDEWLKHPHYKRVSSNLDPAIRGANEALLGTLASIPRVDYVRSR